MKLFAEFLIGIAASLVAGELTGCLKVFSQFIVRRAARRLPSPERERYEEEWLGELRVVQDRLLSGVPWAVFAAWRGSGRLRAELAGDDQRVVKADGPLAIPGDLLLYSCVLQIYPRPAPEQMLRAFEEVAPSAQPLAIYPEGLYVQHVSLDQIETVLSRLGDLAAQPETFAAHVVDIRTVRRRLWPFARLVFWFWPRPSQMSAEATAKIHGTR